MTIKTRMRPTPVKLTHPPVLQPLRAANEELAASRSSISESRQPPKGWDAREVWRTRIKGERDRGSR